MADDVDKRLAEIEAKAKEKQKVARERAAKLKAAQAKAEADRKKRQQEIAQVAEENAQRRGAPATEKRLNPQTEAGRNWFISRSMAGEKSGDDSLLVALVGSIG